VVGVEKVEREEAKAEGREEVGVGVREVVGKGQTIWADMPAQLL
jgi:hypothetical protein